MTCFTKNMENTDSFNTSYFLISHHKTGFHSVLYIQMYMFYLHNNTIIS